MGGVFLTRRKLLIHILFPSSNLATVEFGNQFIGLSFVQLPVLSRQFSSMFESFN